MKLMPGQVFTDEKMWWAVVKTDPDWTQCVKTAAAPPDDEYVASAVKGEIGLIVSIATAEFLSSIERGDRKATASVAVPPEPWT